MGVIGVLFTSIYSLRLLVYVFHRDNVADEKVIAHIHESPFIMIIKTPIKHEISPIILIELIFSLKKK